MYGQGSYFAANASYSDAFARIDSRLRQFMFLGKVLVGSYTIGRSSYRRPPLKNPLDPVSDLCDSCVDNIANPTIFVVFDTDQFYPASTSFNIQRSAKHGRLLLVPMPYHNPMQRPHQTSNRSKAFELLILLPNTQLHHLRYQLPRDGNH